MPQFEAMDVRDAIQGLRKTIPGSTPDLRIDAIVASLEVIAKWIEAFEREMREIRG